MLVPINLTGESYQNRSTPLSSQVTRNFYPEVQGNSSSKSQFVLQPFPGYKLFSAGLGGADRGMLNHREILYKVSGTSLYTVDSAGSHTSRGTVAGTGQVVISGIGTSIIITTSAGLVYSWDGSTFAAETDSDFETPITNAHINNTIIYDGDNDRFCVSDVGAAGTINGLNYATAEGNADNLKRVYTFNERIYMFGDRTIERWWFSGVGKPPVDRIDSGMIAVGLAATYSVGNNTNLMYFLGDDRKVYRLGNSLEAVSSLGVSTAIESYATVSDAIGFCFSLQGQNFYHLTFPTQDKTWCFSETAGWFELSRSSTIKRDLANSHAYIFGKNLVADYRNSNIYEWDVDTYDENGLPMTRSRDTGSIHGGLFRQDGKWLEMNRFELIMEVGIGLTSGQGIDPEIMLQTSDDGGRTFSTEMRATVGRLGEFQWKVEWFVLGGFYDRIIRLSTSDAVRWSIYSASADIEVGI